MYNLGKAMIPIYIVAFQLFLSRCSMNLFKIMKIMKIIVRCKLDGRRVSEMIRN